MKRSTAGNNLSVPKVNESEMKEAIWKSGYLMEKRITAFLRKEGYKAVANRGFMDQETNKSREYDVYAYKDIEVYEAGSYGIYPTLICECKNNAQPVVFFVQEEGFEPLIDEVRVSGIPSKIWKGNKYVSVQEFTKVGSFHHYCKPEVPIATQCCTFEVKKGTSSWMASHGETSYGEKLYEIFRTLTKALEQEIDNDFRNMSQWLVPEEMEREYIDLSFYYPVVIFQGDIYAVSVGKNDLPEKNELTLKKCDHVQYNPEFFSFYNNEVISYHMDVISEEYLSSYLRIIDREMLVIEQILQQEKPTVVRSIGKIIAECMGLEEKPKTYRKHLEYQC
jgi:hypothetical protein